MRKTLTTDQVRQTRVSKLRDKRNQLSDHQWEHLLRSTLLQLRTQASETSSLEKLEVFANSAGDQLSITFRNNISGITQKLGEIVLERDEGEELDIIKWAGAAVDRSNKLDREVRELLSGYDEQSKKIAKLNHELETLIKAKIEHENVLLQNFRELLNSKKLKIRDQQRLLASAKYNPEQAAKLRNARSVSTSRAATASRAGKRKATSGRQASASSEDSGFEGKASKEKPEGDLSEQMNTPEHSDQDLTEDESGDDPDSAHQVVTTPAESKAADGAKGAIGEEVGLDNLPPTRDLSFGEGWKREQAKQPVTQHQSALTQEAGNEDEETDDDEL